jgi:hypothetical protein
MSCTFKLKKELHDSYWPPSVVTKVKYRRLLGRACGYNGGKQGMHTELLRGNLSPYGRPGSRLENNIKLSLWRTVVAFVSGKVNLWVVLSQCQLCVYFKITKTKWQAKERKTFLCQWGGRNTAQLQRKDHDNMPVSYQFKQQFSPLLPNF